MSDDTNDYTVAVNNKKIYDFYSENNNIDFENVNLLLIEFMDSIFNNMTDDLNSNINSQLLSFMKENQTKIENISNSLNTVNQNVTNLTNDITNNMLLQMNNLKKEYIDDFSQIINTNSLTTNEKISSLIDKSNSILVDKTTLILNDIIPKNHETLQIQIKENLKVLHDSITSDTYKLTEHVNNKDAHADFLSNIENKLSTVIQNIQQPLYSTLSATEERLSSSINNIKETTQSSVNTQDKLFGELEGFLGKYKSSTHKGKFGEEQLCSLLNSIYNNAEITNTTGQKAAGDFIMKRTDKPDIMIENKEYNYNIPKEEISKFIRDIEALNMSGIFISQHSGIAFKQNFQIDINNGNILLYIQNCDYDPEKIRLAVDIIDKLSNKLKDINVNDENINISKDILDGINDDYRLFITNKDILHTILRDFTKKMNTQIDDLSMPNLDRYLEPKYAFVKDRVFKCDLCNDFVGKNKQSLSSHKRGCKKRHGTDVDSNNIDA
jgi:flavodoxin